MSSCAKVDSEPTVNATGLHLIGPTGLMRDLEAHERNAMPVPKSQKDRPRTTTATPLLLPVTKEANRIGTCSATAYRWLDAGLLPGSVQVGKRRWSRTLNLHQLPVDHPAGYLPGRPTR